MTDADPVATPEHERMPRHTTPTWEMELLISGATVFALLQLPEAMDAAFYTLYPRFDRAMSALIMLPYVYLTIATYALIVTFVLHLGTRGYWVALVGLRSVYPDGVRWDSVKWGPNYLRVMRERVPAIDVLVERADNRASLVFGFGTGFALLTLAPLFAALAAAIPAFIGHWATGGRYEWIVLWLVSLCVLSLPLMIATVIDRYAGPRLKPEGALARGLRRVFSGYLFGGVSSFSSYPMLMFTTRVGKQRAGIAIALATLVLTTVPITRIVWSSEGFEPGSYAAVFSPGGGAMRTLSPEHYADQRDGATTRWPMPYIASEVVTGDYLRLFIPLRPARDNVALAKHCPDALTGSEAGPGPALDCLGRFYPLSLDGVALAPPRFDLGKDPLTGVRGLVTMIPVATLAAGRHELLVGGPLPAHRAPDPERDAPRRIAFWR